MARWSGTQSERFWAKVLKGDKCWLWQGATDAAGYGRTYMVVHGTPLAHRIAWWFSYGAIPDGMHVCHQCDNPPCVRPSHLFLGTNADNMADRNSKGRQASGDRSGSRRHPEVYLANALKGERNGNARLSEEGVQTVRTLRAEGWSQSRIAKQVGMSQQMVSRILLGQNWKHLDHHEA